MNELTETSKTPRWFLAVLVAGMLVFAFYASTHMVAAGDTWVAMACGRHFDHHGVDTVEPFSFNSHQAGPTDEQLAEAGWPDWTHGIIKTIHPTGWINQNWLTHLGYYKLATWFDGEGDYAWNTLVSWKFAIYFLTVLIVFAIGKVLGAGNLLSAAGACLAMVVGRSFYDIRPAGYSNLLVPVFILILALAVCKYYRWIWLIVPVIVFWANVHGGYIYAFIMLVPFIGIHFLLLLERRWTLSLGFIGLWAVLYLMSHQFITNDYYLTVKELMTGQAAAASLVSNKFFVMLVILSLVSLIMAFIKMIPAGLFYGYHFAVYAIWFLSLFIRFLPGHPNNLTKQFDAIYSYFVSSSQLTFMFVFVAGGLLISAMTFKKAAFASLSIRGLLHTVGASAIALLAMVVFNPFHLTNLTHTFEISVSEHAESWRQVNEWKPAFDFMDKTTDRPNPVGEEEWFGVLCIFTAVIFGFWFIAYFLKPRLYKPAGKRGRKQPVSLDTSAWPKINLALIMLSFLTIYMAIRSRRFIAIAGAAAAPIVALLLVQTWQMISARIRFRQEGVLKPVGFFDTLALAWKGFSDRRNKNNIQSTAGILRTIVYGFISFVLFGLAVFWGLKYKRIYLDPWPTDAKYNSVFMRMTASHLKPIEACEFIRLNKLSGRIFNYWTEGGAVALGQEPDPETGEIPLKLFMDGRAQAAYNHDKFRLWQTIFVGGPVAQKTQQEGKKFTEETYRRIGQWTDRELEKRDVWVTLMPVSQEESVFMKALEATGTWKTAYLDDVQHILVNIESAKGKTLIDQILSGQAKFPNDYTKNSTTFHIITENAVTERYSELYPLAKGAFDLNPSPAALVMLSKLRSLPQAREDIANYLEDFVENRDIYQDQAGYLQQLRTAIVAAQFQARHHPQQREQYQTWARDFRKETGVIEQRQIW